jgi:hypothetical protein
MTAAQVITASAIQDPELWALEFSHWAKEDCEFRDHCFSGSTFLERCFGEWCARVSVPCSPATFQQLLRLEGFSVAGQLVYGLLVKDDAEYLRRSRQTDGSQ